MAVDRPVLVVDDDAVSRHVLAQALASAALPAVVVTSGAEALEWLASQVPSLALLDLVMPPPDGYAVLDGLRKEPRTADVPVVVLTALDSDEEVARAFEQGADDFIRKPFRPSELIARIRSQLRMRQYVEALARREHDAKVVLELTQALSSTLDFRNILFTVVRRIAEVARVDRCSIVLVRDGGDVGYVVAASDDRQLRDLPIDLGKYPEIRQVMRTGEPLVIEDATTHPLFEVVRADLPLTAFRSLAILPILFEDKPLGVLFLRGRQPAAPQEHELWLARTVANATAIALRNARILQSLRDQTQQISFARFEAERRLKSLQRYADFFHSTADGIIVIDPEGQVLFSNPRAREITGWTESALSQASFWDLCDPRDAPTAERIRASFGEGVYPHMVDLAIRVTTDVSCERRILSFSFGSVHLGGAAGEPGNATLVSFRDVTADRATEAELTKTKVFLERVIGSSVDAILSADMNGLVLLFNRAAERCYDYAASDVVGKMHVRDLYPPGRAEEIMRLIHGRDFGGPGRLEGYRTEVMARGGISVPVLLSAALIVEDGKPVGSVGIFTDLRERLRMEARLSKAQEELRAREKQSLIAELAGAAAHELNQPLTSVLGYADLIRRRLDPVATAPASSRSSEPQAQGVGGAACAGEESSAGALGWIDQVLSATNVIVTEAERMAEIVRKIGKITRYETKTYVGGAKILDLDRSSREDESGDTAGDVARLTPAGG